MAKVFIQQPENVYGYGAYAPRPVDHFSYKYPNGLDLRPGSQLHNRICAEVNRRAKRAFNAFSNKSEVWGELEHSLSVYIDLSQHEQDLKGKDSRNPVSIVVPMSYAILETLLTYMTQVFFQDPIFRYLGMDPSPQDQVGALLLGQDVAYQIARTKAEMEIYTSWRDSLVYGFGATYTHWDVDTTWVKQEETLGILPSFLGSMIPSLRKSVMREVIKFEGNRSNAIDPRRYLPDPDVPIHRVQEGEFVGWWTTTNYINLLSDELASDGTIFNVRYLKGKKLPSFLINGRVHEYRMDEDYRDTYNVSGSVEQGSGAVDEVSMFINLIPSEWGLDDVDYPVKYLFSVAGGQYVTRCGPADLEHDMYPVSICAPDTDGRAVAPTSRMEIIYPLQHSLNWLYNSHIENVRRAVNNRIIFDPLRVNQNDVLNNKPGGAIRLLPGAWGSGIDNAIKQLETTDITRGNIQDAMLVADFMKRVSAAVDSVQGVIQGNVDRRTATESNAAHMAAMSRLQKGALLTSVQYMRDLGMIYAFQTQQFLTQERYIRLSGELEKDLLGDYGLKPGDLVKVSPSDLDINFDIAVHDGMMPGAENMEAWVRVFQMLMQNNEAAQMAGLDIGRVFRHVARGLGAKDVNRFVVNVVPDQTAAAAAQAGNVVPAGPDILSQIQ